MKTRTVVGHLSPNDSPPKGNSNKSDSAAADDFSKRVPNGPIVEPAWIAKAIRQPTTARTVLSPVAFTLPNGVHVIVQQKTNHPTFVLRGSIASSPAFEPAGQEGIARLASDVADYGSERYPFEQRRKATDEMGAFVDTGESFSGQAETRDFEKVVDIIADGEMHPTFADPWLGVERSQLANSLSSENSISGVMLDRAYNSLLLSFDGSLFSLSADAANRRRHNAARSVDVCAHVLASGSHRNLDRWRRLAATRTSGARIVIWNVAEFRTRTQRALDGDAAGNQRPRLHRHVRKSSLHPARTARGFAVESGLRRVSRPQPDSRRQRRFLSPAYGKELRQKRGLVYKRRQPRSKPTSIAAIFGSSSMRRRSASLKPYSSCAKSSNNSRHNP